MSFYLIQTDKENYNSERLNKIAGKYLVAGFILFQKRLKNILFLFMRAIY